ncbi:MAG: hypothetical protein K0R48_160 [Gammaproteobacteria bacterium]|jgi:hypothetical protein|nr:hypothetical protein [Gammaproteobacteria bacterium]
MHELMNDVISIINGQTQDRVDGIRASLQRDKLFIFDRKVKIIAGDTVIRLLPNNVQEEYLVINADFFSGDVDTTHYECKLEKIPNIQKNRSTEQPVYNITANQSNVILNSSQSTINSTVDNSNVFSALKSTANKNFQGDALRTINDLISETEKSVGELSFKDKCNQLVSQLAAYGSIFAQIIPAIKQLCS